VVIFVVVPPIPVFLLFCFVSFLKFPVLAVCLALPLTAVNYFTRNGMIVMTATFSTTSARNFRISLWPCSWSASENRVLQRRLAPLAEEYNHRRAFPTFSCKLLVRGEGEA
jgi:hypothetical protein